MDFEEGWVPYNPKEEFGIRVTRTNVHNISSEPLIMEDLVRSFREYNQRIIHIQEKIMHGLKQLQRT